FSRGLSRKSTGADRSLCGPGANESLLESMERPVSTGWALDGRGQAVAHHVEGFDLRSNGWNRCGPHGVASRALGRYAELGLSILLVARRHLYALGLHAPRILRRSTGMERLAYPGDCRQPGPGPDYVRGGRGTMVAGNEYFLAARL